jgi:RNA polymerase sigma-70 factor (ECF subfamily)
LILYSVQGYSTKEIAAMLGISQGAVKTRLCRARERFRQVYGEEN